MKPTKIPLVIDTSGVENPERSAMFEIESVFLREKVQELQREVTRLVDVLAQKGYNKHGQLSLNPRRDNDESGHD